MSAARQRRGVLALVPDDWDVAWQRRHQVLTRLAGYCPVAWISPALHWRERLRQRNALKPPRAVATSRLFTLTSRDDLPTVNAPRQLRDAIVRRRARLGAMWLRDQGCEAIELQIWLPELAVALDVIDHASVSYHIDDEYSWSTIDAPLPDEERRLIERVDRVYVTSRKLLETKGGINPNTLVSPNGVDYALFSTPRTEPDDLARVPHPRAGYVGVLKEQLDWDLLIALATTRSDWSFVIVGPVRAVHESVHESLAALTRLANVYMLGEKSPQALPAYVQAMDVALLPYRRNAYTDAIDPLKLYEALAAGIPVVSTPIRTVLEMEDAVMTADGAEQWSEALSSAIDSRSNDRRAKRQRIAREHDWNIIVARMAESIARG